MSSLAATQADGYYVGTAYFDSGAYKKQSKNEWHRRQQQQQQKQQNDQGDKVRNHHHSTLGGPPSSHAVVRFELPYSGRCVECHHFIMRGTRYNATKHATDDSYFTTRILEFRIKCRACQQCEFVIRTDPQARGFVYVSGIEQRKGLEDRADVGTHGPSSSASASASLAAPSTLERLEKQQLGRRIAMSETEQLQMLQKVSHNTYEHDADGNAKIRSTFRQDRHTKKRRLQQGQAMGWKSGMPLLDASHEDETKAKMAVFGNVRHDQQQKWHQVNRQSMFAEPKKKAKPKRGTRRGNEVEDDEIRPDGVVSAMVTTERRRRGKEGPTVDLTSDRKTESACMPLAKRKRIIMPTASGLKPVDDFNSLSALMHGYGSSDSD